MEKIFFSMDYKTYNKSREVCSTWNELLTSDTYRSKEKLVFREEILRLRFPQILERIFFSMDYKNYKKCRKVCSAWNELLTSDTYRSKEKLVFRREILKLEDDLLDASREGRAEDVFKLLHNDVLDINFRDRHYRLTPLTAAARNGHTSVVEILIEKGADVNKADKLGWMTPLAGKFGAGFQGIGGWMTPLGMAAFGGHINVVQLLLAKGAYPNMACGQGWTPLHCAAEMGHKDVVKVLYEAGADRNMTNFDGKKPAELDLERWKFI